MSTVLKIVARPEATGLWRVIHTRTRMTSQGAIGLWNPELKLKHRRKEAPRTAQGTGGVKVRQLQDCRVVSELRGACGGRNDKDKEHRQCWDRKQDVRYLKEGIDDENKHFEECP